MANIRRHLISRRLCLALAAALSGLGAELPQRRIEFAVFAAEPVSDVAFSSHAGAEPVTLQFYPTALSPIYSYTGRDPITFYDRGTGEVVAEVSPPADLRRALFLFSALPQRSRDGLRCRVQVFDDSEQRMPPESLTILNVSGLELSGVIDARTVTLREGLNEPLRVGETAEVLLQTRFRGRVYQSFSDRVSLGGAGRALLILLPPYRPGALEVQFRLLQN